MPLTCPARVYNPGVYKKFPSGLADNVTAHVKKRADTYRFCRTGFIDNKDLIIDDDMEPPDRCKENLKKKLEPASETSNSIERPSCTKRPRTPLCSLLRRRDVSAPGRCACTKDTSGVQQQDNRQRESRTLRVRVPSPIGCNKRSFVPVTPGRDEVLLIDQVSMDLDSRCGSPCSFPPRSRLGRPNSRTTVSLDNVDLWESEDEADTSYDQIDGVPINPRQTFDFSEFRRLNRSPLSTMGLRQCWTESSQYTPNPSEEPLPTKSGKVIASSGLPLNQTVDLSESRLPLAFHIMNSPLLAKKQQQRQEREQAEMTSRSPSPQSHPAEDTPHTSGAPSHRSDSSPATRRRPRVRVTEELRPLFTRREPALHNHPPSSDTKDIPTSTLRHTTGMVGEPNVGQILSPMSARKVTFSNLVSVREGDSNTLNALRNSNNSAHWFKQKYLSKPRRSRQETIPTEDTTDNWQLAF